jgi:hypothetical protein
MKDICTNNSVGGRKYLSLRSGRRQEAGGRRQEAGGKRVKTLVYLSIQ